MLQLGPGHFVVHIWAPKIRARSRGIDRPFEAAALSVRRRQTLSDPSGSAPPFAPAGTWWIIISEAGRRARDGQSQATIADELSLMIENVLDELDRWFTRRPPARDVDLR